MERKDKEAFVEEVAGLFGEADAMYVADYRGLTVAEIGELRGALRPSGARFRVLKNTLTRRAAKSAGRDDLLPLLSGPTAIAFCAEDPVAPARALADFARTHEALVLRGGLLEGATIESADIKALASLPPRDALLGQVVGTMVAPISGLVTVLSETVGGLARTLQQIADQKEAAA